MHVFIVEDIISVTNEIKQNLLNVSTCTIYNSVLEFNANNSAVRDESIATADIFFLDFCLENGYTILNSGIFHKIISLKKKSAQLVSISTMSPEFILQEFKTAKFKMTPETYFEKFIKKSPRLILNYVQERINEQNRYK